MKKLILFITLGVIFCSITLTLIGCGSSNSVESNISDIRYGIFDAETENLYANFIYGEREDPYKLDGIKNSNVSFGIISINFKNKQSKSEFDFELTYGEETYKGKLEKSPYTDEYMADIGKQLNSFDTLQLKIDEEVIILKKCSTDWKIDYKKALQIGKDALKNEIKAMQKEGQCEYQLKIIYNNKTNYGIYFWSFTAISKKGEKHTVVFSPNCEDILVKN